MHVGNVRRVPLAKAHQHPALCADVLDGQARAAAVIPFRAGDRLQPAARFHAADALQVVPQRLELDAALLPGTDVLQRAAAATAEHRAASIDAIR